MAWLSAASDPPDPLIALLVGVALLVGAALLVWPKGGLLGRSRRIRQVSARVLREDVLKQLCTAELEGDRLTTRSIAGALEIGVDQAAEVLADLERRQLVVFEGPIPRLTQNGKEYGLQMVRIHRLWELYLADTTGLQEAEWHTRADLLEHTVTGAEISELSRALGNPLHDPHGDPIPTEEGELVTRETVPLPEAPVDRPVRIAHIEDEPTVVYRQIVAESLSPGTIVRVLEKDSQRIRFWAEGSERVLAPSLANNVGVVPVPAKHAADVERELVDSSRLSLLRTGDRARVIGISRACRGPERRRLMDLGFVPGTEVEVAMVSPSLDPTAYLVRGTLIALRREQAGWIRVSPQEEATA